MDIHGRKKAGRGLRVNVGHTHLLEMPIIIATSTFLFQLQPGGDDEYMKLHLYQVVHTFFLS
jgi:hypothetical protein